MINSIVLPNSFKLQSKLQCQNEQNLQVNFDEVEFLACGQDHVVFLLDKSKENVIIFNKKNKNQSSHTQLQRNVYQKLEDVYEKLIEKHFKHVSKYLWKRKGMYLQITHQQQMGNICQVLQNKQKQQSIKSQKIFNLDRKQRKVYITKNLFSTQKFSDTIIQFKPKSVLPDCYSLNTINKLSVQFNLSADKIKEILRSSQPFEKTRWFKKSQIKKSQKKQNKLNENPFHIYKINPTQSQTKIPNFINSKCYKKLNKVTENQQNQLNMRILNAIHKDKQFLQQIHKLQSLFLSSPEQINTTNLQNDDLITKQKLFEQLEVQISKQSSQIVKLQNIYNYLIDFKCLSKNIKNQQSNLCSILQYLISLTWKDISIVYKQKKKQNINQQQECQLWIIDDYLKKINKIKQNVQKDQEFLRQYLRYKLNINDFMGK